MDISKMTVNCGNDKAYFLLNGQKNRICTFSNSLTDGVIGKDNAIGFALAVNSTWGAGINPEALPELLRTFNNLIEYFEFMVNDPKFHAYVEAKAAFNKAKIV